MAPRTRTSFEVLFHYQERSMILRPQALDGGKRPMVDTSLLSELASTYGSCNSIQSQCEMAVAAAAAAASAPPDSLACCLKQASKSSTKDTTEPAPPSSTVRYTTGKKKTHHYSIVVQLYSPQAPLLGLPLITSALNPPPPRLPVTTPIVPSSEGGLIVRVWGKFRKVAVDFFAR